MESNINKELKRLVELSKQSKLLYQGHHDLGISTDDKEVEHLFRNVLSFKLEDKKLAVEHYFTKEVYEEVKKFMELGETISILIKIGELEISEVYSVHDYSIEVKADIKANELVTIIVYLGEIYLFKNRTSKVKQSEVK